VKLIATGVFGWVAGVQVCTWLESVGLGEVVGSFREAGIDGVGLAQLRELQVCSPSLPPPLLLSPPLLLPGRHCASLGSAQGSICMSCMFVVEMRREAARGYGRQTVRERLEEKI
jgi:hypothetical protein